MKNTIKSTPNKNTKPQKLQIKAYQKKTLYLGLSKILHIYKSKWINQKEKSLTWTS